MTTRRSMLSIQLRLVIQEKYTASANHRLVSFGTRKNKVCLCYLIVAACAEVLDRVQNRKQQCDNLWSRGSFAKLCLYESSFFFIFFHFLQKKKKTRTKFSPLNSPFFFFFFASSLVVERVCSPPLSFPSSSSSFPIFFLTSSIRLVPVEVNLFQ